MNYFPYILFAAAIHGFIFSLVLFTSRKGFYTANIVLGILILSLSLELFTSIEILFPSSGSIMRINPVIFLYGPLLYLYVLLTTRKNRSEYSSFIYAILPVYCIPLVIYVYSYISFAFNFSMEVKVQPEMKDHILGTDIFTNSPGILLLFLVNTCLYLLLTLREVKAYSEEIKLRFSSIKKITFKWICLMVYLWIALLVVFTLFFILHFFSIFPVQNVFMILRCAIACVIFVIGYFNLRYPLFYQYPINESENNEISSESYEDEKSKEKNRSNLSTTDYSQKKQKILQYMKEEKPYLNSNLTINELSQNLGMHYKTLSKILNKEFGCTFYDIINKYRVNEVKEKLRDTNNTNLTIMSIAYECGFNSKSSFNTLFKKITGKTPSDYRK